MAPIDPGPLETDLQTQILNWLKKQNIVHWRTVIGGRAIKGGRGKNPMAGFPDLCIVIGDTGRLLAVELKRRGEKLDPKQVDWSIYLLRGGVNFVVANTLDEVISAYWKALTRHA